METSNSEPPAAQLCTEEAACSSGDWCLGLVLVLRKKGYYGLTVLEKQTPLLPHRFNMDASWAF